MEITKTTSTVQQGLPKTTSWYSRVPWEKWGHTFMLSVIVYCFGLGYMALYLKSFSWLIALSSAAAFTGAILFGVSFALSGITYFFDFADPYLGLRKYLGIWGYWYAMGYSVSLFFINPQRYFFGFFTSYWTPDVQLGLWAMSIFTVMWIDSFPRMMHIVGGKHWRQILRLGYVAYGLLVVRAVILEWEMWRLWASTLDGLPPPRIILSLFALLVIALRIALSVSLRFSSRKVAAS